MLRTLVLLLLLANLAVWAWSQGWTSPWLPGPGAGQREPARLGQQVQPEALRVLGPRAASAALDREVENAEQRAAQAASGASDASPAGGASAPASASDPAPPASAASAVSSPVAAACLETDALASAELSSAERALRAAQPSLRWATLRQERGGVFIVYMGRYTDRPTLLKKQDELRRLGVAFREMDDSPTLVPGLQLGRFEDRSAANQALAALTAKGVRSARVATLVAPVPVAVLRVDKPAAALASQLQSLDLGAGAHFKPCATLPRA